MEIVKWAYAVRKGGKRRKREPVESRFYARGLARLEHNAQAYVHTICMYVWARVQDRTAQDRVLS